MNKYYILFFIIIKIYITDLQQSHIIMLSLYLYYYEGVTLKKANHFILLQQWLITTDIFFIGTL